MNVTIEEFKKLEIRIGKVLACEKVEGADKLLEFEIDFGPSTSHSTVSSDRIGSGSSKHQIVSGIAEFYKPEDLIGKEFPFIVNLEPRLIRGIESQGMIMAVDTGESVVLLTPDKEVPEGSIVR